MISITPLLSLARSQRHPPQPTSKGMTFMLALLALLLTINAPSAFAVMDIECSIVSIGSPEISGSVYIKKIPVPDKAPQTMADWTIVDLGHNKGMAIVCENPEAQELFCTFIPGKRVKPGEEFHFEDDRLFTMTALFGMGQAGNRDYRTFCASASLLGEHYKEAEISMRAPVPERSLTQSELDFCSHLGNFGNILLRDDRPFCANFLKALPRSLTPVELDYCKQQYSPQGAGWDKRLECTKDITTQ